MTNNFKACPTHFSRVGGKFRLHLPQISAESLGGTFTFPP